MKLKHILAAGFAAVSAIFGAGATMALSRQALNENTAAVSELQKSETDHEKRITRMEQAITDLVDTVHEIDRKVSR